MILLSWNVRGQGLKGSRLERVIDAIVGEKPGLVTLQEVPTVLADNLREGLAAAGLKDFHHSGGAGKSYGNVIASRWPIEAAKRSKNAGPYPELVARAKVAVPGGRLDLITVHVPNGAGHGWEKVAFFEALGQLLREAGDAARILTGDFNEPQTWFSSGQMVTFGQRLKEAGSVTIPRKLSKIVSPGGTSETKDGLVWTRAVRSVLAGESEHGLRNVYRDLHGYEKSPTTHVVSGKRRCFDHAFASRHVEIEACEYLHAWRKNGLSDHSPMKITFAIKKRPGRLESRAER
jgi:endonuclease/exonuclease/phosphatase family metal-dependent hydrolase